MELSRIMYYTFAVWTACVMELPRIMYYTFVVWTVWEKVFFRMAMEVFISLSRFAFTYRKEKESLPYFPQSISHLQIIYHKSFSISLLTCLHAWLRRIFIHTLFRFRSNFQTLLPMLLSAYQNLLLNHAQYSRNHLPSWWTYANDTAVTMAATTLT